ncbi:hypothetical protein Ddc_20300 [Ditylenchus destructor]|nr:hypothetical protein Ddc_20300 [Ditylenchus destructor]
MFQKLKKKYVQQNCRTLYKLDGGDNGVMMKTADFSGENGAAAMSELGWSRFSILTVFTKKTFAPQLGSGRAISELLPLGERKRLVPVSQTNTPSSGIYAVKSRQVIAHWTGLEVGSGPMCTCVQRATSDARWY